MEANLNEMQYKLSEQIFEKNTDFQQIQSLSTDQIFQAKAEYYAKARGI